MITCSAATKGASSNTYITASAKREATSDSAETTGLRWRITTNAKITAIAAKKKKTAYSIMTRSLGFLVARLLGRRVPEQPSNRATQQPFSNPPLRDEPGHQHDIDHCQRQENFPAEAHEDVVLEPGDRPAHPDEDEHQNADFDHESDRREQEAEEGGRLVVPGDVPSPEEERDHDGRHGGHRDIFRHEKE